MVFQTTHSNEPLLQESLDLGFASSYKTRDLNQDEFYIEKTFFKLLM
jgi:hypothetical protein